MRNKKIKKTKIMVLADGETWTEIKRCKIIEIPSKWLTDTNMAKAKVDLALRNCYPEKKYIKIVKEF